jgi:hypothetical protein
MLEMLQKNDAPLYTWESSIQTSNPDVLEFYNENKEFYVRIHQEDGKSILLFYSVAGELKLATSSIINVTRNGSYRRVETRNTVYHLLAIEPKPVVAVKTEPVEQPKKINVTELMKKIHSQYRYACYGSPCSAFTDALNDKFVTNEEYAAAKKFYGSLWNYVGD